MKGGAGDGTSDDDEDVDELESDNDDDNDDGSDDDKSRAGNKSEDSEHDHAKDPVDQESVIKKKLSTGAAGDEWKCSSCTRVDESIPMIGCDSCDSWFHWSCVGIVIEPRKEDVWICSDCRRVKPLKKAKDKYKVSASCSYSATPSSTRPGSSSGTSARTGPRIKTGSGHPKKSSSLLSSTLPSSSSKQASSAILPPKSGAKVKEPGIATELTASSQGWMCASCKTCKDQSIPMIGCDSCDSWHHWGCVGIQVDPGENESWFCALCISKQNTFPPSLRT